MLVTTYNATWQHNPEDHSQHLVLWDPQIWDMHMVAFQDSLKLNKGYKKCFIAELDQ